MALQLRRAATKLFNPTLNLIRNRSRSSLPSLFWGDPLRQPRSLFQDFWNTPDPFDWALPSRLKKMMGLKLPEKFKNYNRDQSTNSKMTNILKHDQI